MYEGLGLSPSKPVTPSGLRVGSDYLTSREVDLASDRAGSESDIETPMEGLGLGDVEVIPRIGPYSGEVGENASGYDSGYSSRVASGGHTSSYDLSAERVVSGGSIGVEVEVSEGWRGQPVLYCCACVAGL